MKTRLIGSSIMGALAGIIYYVWGPRHIYPVLRHQAFSQEKAWLVSIIIFLLVFVYAYSELSKDGNVLEKSKDKKKALNHTPAKEFLSTEPNGLTVGKYKRHYTRLLFNDSPEHQLIIGGPGDNKSTVTENGIIYNFNFASDEEKLCSVLALDVKPELSRRGVYEGRHDVRIINPSVKNTCGFDIFFGLSAKSSDDELSERCTMIANTIIKDTGSDNVYFAEAARNIFTAFIMYGFRTAKSWKECIEEILDAPVEDLIAQILSDDEMSDHPKIKRLIREFDGKTSDGFQDVAMTLKKDLAIFDTESVKECFDKDNPKKCSPNDLVNGISIFLAIPDHLLLQYASVFRLIINTCLTHIMSQPETERKNKRPIWVLIDEAGSIGKFPILGDVLARGRSKGSQCSLVIQSEGQLDATYGKDMARAIKDCCKSTIVFGSNDVYTCDSLSKRTGMYSESKTSTTTRGGGFSANSSHSESTEYRPAVDVADIQNLSKNNKVLVFTKGDWFIVNKAPYYTIPQLNDKSIEIEKQNEELRQRNSSN